ncbi:FAD binding domain-containing protein [Azorhizobium caulinodans]|uniref:FAD binding domain-containing protein n=1 Tax=Azorhizobium caulinodans TaxID=7 RepID=UPI002FBDF0DF
MDLNTVTALHRPRTRDEIGPFRAGDAFLAGGTALFAAPDPALSRLIDLPALNWPPVTLTADAVEIAATCTFAELEEASLPPRLSSLIARCCGALYGSFKVRAAATIGGNLCTALAAAPMAAFAVALDAELLIWRADGTARTLPAREFILAPTRTRLGTGELLRSILVPACNMDLRWAFRRIALNELGRSAALVIGTQDGAGRFGLTITASTPRPVRLDFPALPDAETLLAALDAAVSPVGWYDDVHGDPLWRAHMTRLFAQQVRSELAGEAA